MKHEQVKTYPSEQLEMTFEEAGNEEIQLLKDDCKSLLENGLSSIANNLTGDGRLMRLYHYVREHPKASRYLFGPDGINSIEAAYRQRMTENQKEDQGEGAHGKY